LTCGEVAVELGLSTERIRQLADEGALKSLRTEGGTIRLFRRVAVDDYKRRIFEKKTLRPEWRRHK
jgi:excisionase family DNA binding protein